MIEEILANLDQLDEAEKVQVLSLLEQYEKAKYAKDSKDKYMSFVKQMWPEFIEGRHHKIMAKKFEEIAEGKIKRLIINMPPRHTKSEFASYLLPGWLLGKFPNKKVIQASHTAELSVGFGRKVRNLISNDEFGRIFPRVGLQADSKAAGRWSTSKGGEYFAIGVGGNVAGKGADFFIIDDPHSEQDGKNLNSDSFDSAYEWYLTGPRQRLQPGGTIILVMTRWGKRDLTGRLLEDAAKNPNSDQWEVIEFPAIMPSGLPLWPEFWSLEELEKTKATLLPRFWAAQYQQTPTSAESALIKREWWKIWTPEKPPPCEFIIQSWDTAFTKNTRSDYSACTTWGVFYDDDEKGKPYPNVILLDSFKERMEFPELKAVALEHWKNWNPDAFIVEAKASGLPLIYELRKMGIPVQDFTPTKGNDKISRVNAVADLFSSGIIWIPETRWAQELVEEVADFPNGANDDLVDSMSQALLRFRQGGFIRLQTDDWVESKPRQRTNYY